MIASTRGARLLPRPLSRHRARTADAGRRVGAVLRASVAPAPLEERRERVAALASGPLDGLAGAAERHGIAGYVRLAIDGVPEVDPAERAKLTDSYRASVGTHVRILAALGWVRDALDAEVGQWAVVKGPVLTEPVHGRPDLRSYGDLDIVVPAARLGRALATLERRGGETLDRNWTLQARELRGEVHVRVPGDVLVDLHWHLINERDIRDRLPIPMVELLERRRWVRVGRLDVPTLDPEDTLLHLAVHAVLSGGHRLVWFKDVERAAARGVDWDTVVERARRWRVDLVVGVALAQVHRVLDGDVPAEVVRALARSRTWRAATAVANRVAPVERESGQGSVTRIVARSVRDSAAASWGTLARKSVLYVRHRDDTVDRLGRAFAPDDHGSMAYESGGEAARRAFLSAVARKDPDVGPESAR